MCGRSSLENQCGDLNEKQMYENLYEMYVTLWSLNMAQPNQAKDISIYFN